MPNNPLPFHPEPPAKLVKRVRAAIVKVWDTAAADVQAWAEPAQVFDFPGGIRVVLTVEDGAGYQGAPAAGLVLHAAAEAPGDGPHRPLEARHQLTVLWMLNQLKIDKQLKPLHSYGDKRVHLIFKAPEGAGEPIPEPEPPAPEPEAPKVEPPPAEVFDIEIPPGLKAGLGHAKATRRQ